MKLDLFKEGFGRLSGLVDKKAAMTVFLCG